MLGYGIGSKRVELAVHPPLSRLPMSEGHLLVDRTVERLQALWRLRHIRAIRQARRKSRQDTAALAAKTPPRTPYAPETSRPAPAASAAPIYDSPYSAPGRPPWPTRAWARSRHMAAASGHVLMAGGALASVAYMTVLYYLEYIPEVRHLHIETYPLLRDFSPEYIRFIVSYGLPAGVGALALSKAVLKFIDRIKAAKELWHQFHHPTPVPASPPTGPSAAPLSSPLGEDLPPGPPPIESSGWGE